MRLFCLAFVLVFLALTTDALLISTTNNETLPVTSLKTSLSDFYRQYLNQLRPTFDDFPTLARKMDDPLVFRDILQQNAGFSQIAYCINDDKSLQKLEYNRFMYPDVLRKMIPIVYDEKVNLSKSSDEPLAYRYNMTHIFTDKVNHKEWFAHGGGQGFLLLDHKKKLIVISMKGSKTTADWVTNLDFLPTRFTPVSFKAKYWNQLKDIKSTPIYKKLARANFKKFNNFKSKKYYVHRGFKQVADRILPEIQHELIKWLELYPDYSVVVTGHSLGGAIAQLISLELNIIGIQNLLVTMNAPSVLSSKLSKDYDKMAMIDQFELKAGARQGAVRLFHFFDIVPRIIPSPLYSHIGAPVTVYNMELPHNIEDVYLLTMGYLNRYSFSEKGLQDQEIDYDECSSIAEYMKSETGESNAALFSMDEAIDTIYHCHRNTLVFFSACSFCLQEDSC